MALRRHAQSAQGISSPLSSLAVSSALLWSAVSCCGVLSCWGADSALWLSLLVLVVVLLWVVLWVLLSVLPTAWLLRAALTRSVVEAPRLSPALASASMEVLEALTVAASRSKSARLHPFRLMAWCPSRMVR